MNMTWYSAFTMYSIKRILWGIITFICLFICWTVETERDNKTEKDLLSSGFSSKCLQLGLVQDKIKSWKFNSVLSVQFFQVSGWQWTSWAIICCQLGCTLLRSWNWERIGLQLQHLNIVCRHPRKSPKTNASPHYNF